MNYLVIALILLASNCYATTTNKVASTQSSPSSSISSSSSSVEDSSKQIDNYTSEVVQNDKIREIYVKCLLDKGPCSYEASEIKKVMPEAIEKGCQKCSEIQKRIIEKMMIYLKEKQPEILQQVGNKFDPRGEFIKTFIGKLMKDKAAATSGNNATQRNNA